MSGIHAAVTEIGRLDRLAGQDTFLHRLDPRAKLVTTIVFLICVVSVGKYEISVLLPFSLYPVMVATLGSVPLGYLLRRLATVAPFAILVGIFNPLLDREPMLSLGQITISGGWVSFGSILVRSVLTLGAAILLVATTSFSGVCLAMDRLGAPRIFTVQLLFLYRYLFVLGDEAYRLVRARALRSFGGRGMGMRVFAQMIGSLLLRTIDRAERIHLAMLCRGFDGEVRIMRALKPGWVDAAFVLGWCSVFVTLRWVNLTQLIGRMATGSVP